MIDPNDDEITGLVQWHLNKAFLFAVRDLIKSIAYEQKWNCDADLKYCSKFDIRERRAYLFTTREKIGSLVSNLKYAHRLTPAYFKVARLANRDLAKIRSSIEEELALSKRARQIFGKKIHMATTP